MVQAFRSNSAIQVRFVVGMSVVILISMCVAVSLSRATAHQPQPTELDMEANDANFLLNSLPSMAKSYDTPSPAPVPQKAKKATDNAPTSEADIMQHDIDSLKKNLKAHLMKETSDHIQLNNLKTDRDKAMLVEQSLEAKIAAEKIQLNALEGHVSTVSAPASSLASTSDKSNPSISAATPVASAHADKMAQDAMIKALKSVHVPHQMKSKLSSDIKKVRNVLKADQLQKEALAKIEMKISTLQAAEAQDKASLADVSKLQAKLKGAAQILSSRVQKDASKLQGFIIKQDQLASAVRRDEVRDQKLKSLVSYFEKEGSSCRGNPC